MKGNEDFVVLLLEAKVWVENSLNEKGRSILKETFWIIKREKGIAEVKGNFSIVPEVEDIISVHENLQVNPISI